MGNIKLSVIIPVYNTEKYLGKCLDSIINQRLKNIEIICINDESNDNSLKILEQYAEKDNRIKIFNISHSGAGVARNIGLKNSNGDYTIFMDSDDWIADNAYEILYNHAKLNDTDIIMFKLINYDEKNDKLYKDSIYDLKALEKFHNGQIFKHENVEPERIFKIATGAVNKFYKSSFLKRINATFPEGLIFEDNPFFYHCFLNAKRVSIFDSYLYFRRRRFGSVMMATDKRYLDIIPITDIIFDIFKSNNQFNYYKENLHNQKINWLRQAYNSIDINYKEEMYEKIKENLFFKDIESFQEFENNLNDSNLSFHKNIFNSERFQELDLLIEFQNLKKTIHKKNNIIKKQKKQINSIEKSISWKITYPIRNFISYFKKLLNSMVLTSILLKRRNLKKTWLDFKGYNKIKKLKLFDEDFYRNEHDYKISGDLLIHYMYHGYKNGKDPNPNFNSKFYLKKYANVKKAKINPLVHYSLYGLKEGKCQNIFEEIKNDIRNYKTGKKKKILFLLHAFGGGTSQTNEDLMQHVEKEYECYLLHQGNKKISLWQHKDKEYITVGVWRAKSNWSIDKLYDEEFEEIYFQILSNLNVDLIHIRHLINHTFDLPNIANELKIPMVLSFHDFYFICPSYCLLDENFNYCNGSCNNNTEKCISFLNMGKIENLKSYINVWRDNAFKLFSKIDYFITTSIIVKDLFLSIYPDMKKEKFHIIEHGRDFLNNNEIISTVPTENKPIKILFPGILKEHKGVNLIKEIKKLDKESKLEFHFIGKIPKSLINTGIYHGEYKRENFCEKVNEIKPSFIGIFSVWPETYCHTLTESWSCNIPVLASKIGVIEDRVLKNNGGWFIDINDAESSYNTILKISNDKNKYMKVQKDLIKLNFKNSEEMAKEYIGIYKKLIK